MAENLIDQLQIAGESFASRLILGTAKFPSLDILKNSILKAGCSHVTVALRRVDEGSSFNIMDAIPSGVTVIANTSGARHAQDALRLARIAQEAGLGNLIKCEVKPDPISLLPDPIETYTATKALVDEGFKVMPYMSCDPLLARKLEDAGAACLMPLGSPIGSNQGIENPKALQAMIHQTDLPVIVDAGLGLPSQAAQVMEMGGAGVMLNTAIAGAEDPVAMAQAFAKATEAGRQAYLAGPEGPQAQARASSPLTAFLE